RAQTEASPSMSAFENSVPLPPTIRLLTEHLDMLLAAGEDLNALSCDMAVVTATGVPASFVKGPEDETTRDLHSFVTQAAILERACANRAMSARVRTHELVDEDERFRTIGRLFLGGTAQLADLVEQMSAADAQHLADTSCPMTYLRSRSVIANDAVGPDPYETLRIDETFLISKIVPLGGLMDMTAGFLDALERHYEIFPTIADYATQAERLPTPNRGQPEIQRLSLDDALAALRQASSR
ncbi:MAG: hypothetical protein AAFR60_12285, partial [Pseudomonadota bacterium]